MARQRDPRRDEAFDIFKQHDGDITNRAIAEQLEVPEKTISAWKSRDKWNVVLQTNECSTTIKNVQRERGAPVGNANAKGNRGNKNASAPKQNSNALTHGFFQKFLPEETLEIMEAMNERSPADLIWDQIQIQYAAIIRAQRIMHVESKDEMIKELKKAKYEYYPRSKEDGGGVEKAVTEEEYNFQFAWERQAQLLTAQSRAIGELRSSIRQFVEMADQDDERRLKLEQMQLNINKTKAEISKLENPDSNKQESEIAKMLRRMAGEE
ncbi:phage terminase small subunit [Lysinibacillus sp. ACHW1.5]|uniref:phage terminase small subunit n=1 Tax=Lysinibacillus sp. ACHW1.5 TaxID=2913506 RepID=UPI001EDA307B|nr:phage terminase small subunit [Lysinibacillus sp. ACHW1.5]UKJ44301.1 phage terminase small subunit [Lysinibacillus sp. ACHW1.5]